VHRAEILTLTGAWDDALAELHRLAEPITEGALNQLARGDAAYREAEVLRLRGSALAESRYIRAGELGREPLPGLALLRLQQGRLDVAAATIRRGVLEAPRGLARVALLPAYVEIMLAVGDVDAATVAARELAETAVAQNSEAIEVMARTAQGAVLLADGNAGAALPVLRAAMVAWQEQEAPYEAARARAMVGRACRLLGDEESAVRELEAAREAFAGLGAGPDLTALAASNPAIDSRDLHGLSPREREVLRLVASGASNRQISATLVLSEHTVARHLQNIFLKLQVSSRTAASAYAHQHHLV
jgi:DNA-binding NarL/FixJ family response regulator